MIKGLRTQLIYTKLEPKQEYFQFSSTQPEAGALALSSTQVEAGVLAISSTQVGFIGQSIKRHSVDTEETPQQVITQELRDISDSAAVKLPAIRSIRRCIRHYRHDAGNAQQTHRPVQTWSSQRSALAHLLANHFCYLTVAQWRIESFYSPLILSCGP